jgi:hypothetical protein
VLIFYSAAFFTPKYPFMLISKQYQAVLTLEHSASKWGSTGLRHAPFVNDLMVQHGFNSLLDYGSGQGLLARWFARDMLKIQLQEYEPGIPHLADPPRPAELVACVDVMEHVEPDCVIAVLDHIQQLAQRMVYFHISLRPAARILNDGRNAHLTVKPMSWWIALLTERWHSVTVSEQLNSFTWIGSQKLP